MNDYDFGSQEKLSVECTCMHMSYFTLIEDRALMRYEFDGPLEYPEVERKFSDWPLVAIGGYIVIVLIS